MTLRAADSKPHPLRAREEDIGWPCRAKQPVPLDSSGSSEHETFGGARKGSQGKDVEITSSSFTARDAVERIVSIFIRRLKR